MKKRIIACMLCLSILFSVSTAVFAKTDTMALFAEAEANQEATQLPEGHLPLYVNRSTNVTKSAETTGIVKFRLTPDGDLLDGEGWTPSCSNEDMGKLYCDGSNWRWDLGGVLPGTTGYLTLTDETGKSYSIFATVEQAIVGIYTQDAIDFDDPGEGYLVRANGCYTVSYDGMGGIRAVYAIPGFDNMTIVEDSIDCTNADQVDLAILPNGALEIALKEEIANETVSTEVYFKVLESYEGGADELEFDFTIVFEAENEQIPTEFPEHPLKEEEKLPEKWRDYEERGAGPVAFAYEGDTYYVGRGDRQPSTFGGDNLNWDETRRRESRIGFWTMDKDGNYFPVQDPNLLEKLRAQFTSLTLTIYADNNIPSGEYPAKYPTVEYQTDGAIFHTFTNQQNGLWVYVVEGTLADSTEFVSFSWFGYEFKQEMVFEADSVAEANDYLAYIINNCPDDVNYVLQLPEGTLSGIIEIPEARGAWPITIRGAVDEYGNPATVLKGGIVADAGRHCALEYLILQGAGKNYKTWPNDVEGLAGYANIGLSGTATAFYDHCEFLDYDIAVLCTDGLRFGGVATCFANNGIGIYVDTPAHWGGQAAMDWCVFTENGIAIWIEQLEHNDGNTPMSVYEIIKSCFIENKCDIKNTTGKKFFIAGNYFQHNGSAISALDGNLRPWLAGRVYIAPVYTNWDVAEGGEIVLSNAYWGEYATLRNGDTAKYDLRVQELAGMTLNVIDQPDAENETTVTFQFGEPTETLSLFGGEEQTFDASVQVEKAENEIAVTINEIPAGLAANMTVSCGDWTAATVTFDGDPIVSTVSNGNVRFLAERGGTYIIQKSLPDTAAIRAEVSEGILTVTNAAVQPTDRVELIILVAGYDPEGKLNGCQVVENVTGVIDIELTVSGNLKVFLVKPGTYAPVHEMPGL